MAGALWAKRGERDISRGARHEREARDALFARNIAFRSSRLAHKAPVMQAIVLPYPQGEGDMGGLEHRNTAKEINKHRITKSQRKPQHRK